jgi:TIGR02646 family protein
MLFIRKGSEPDSLIKYRKEKFAYYDGYEKKDDIRKKLLEEQGYLCAYCMRRIDIKNMKIEHWYPEDRLSDVKKLEYSNMLGVCTGHIEGTKGVDDTCDTHKGNILITVSPLDMSTLSKIKYRTSTGEIYSEDKQIQKDLNDTLNLNSSKHLLSINRKTVLNTVIMEMSKMQKKGIWSRRVIESIKEQYEKMDITGKKKEYAGIVLWYLNKKLKQKT